MDNRWDNRFPVTSLGHIDFVSDEWHRKWHKFIHRHLAATVFRETHVDSNPRKNRNNG